MVEYTGWAVIKQSLDGEDEDDMPIVFEQLSLYLKKIEYQQRFIMLKPINGNFFLNCCGFTNHHTEDVKDIVALFHFIPKIAVGSYGLLYLRDDENPALDNEFIVYKIARGNCTIEKDNYLSPCRPTIES